MQGLWPFAVISIKPIKRKNMKRTFKTLGIFLSAIFLLTACSSDDEPKEATVPCFCEGNIIKTVNYLTGVMKYNKQLDRWYIYDHFHQLISYDTEYYCPVDLDKKYKKEGLAVRFSGDLYELRIDGEITTVEESEYLSLSRYCIDLISIEEYK